MMKSAMCDEQKSFGKGEKLKLLFFIIITNCFAIIYCRKERHGIGWTGRGICCCRLFLLYRHVGRRIILLIIGRLLVAMFEVKQYTFALFKYQKVDGTGRSHFD